MRKCISIHSNRGGTGKTLLATNLAALYAQSGLNVALLDLDFRAPSLVGVFSKVSAPSPQHYLNAYLDGRCAAEAAMIEVSSVYGFRGKFFVSLANPDINAIRGMMDKSRSWEVTAVKRLFSLRSKLFKDMGVDCCIYDTSPGIQYASVNAAVSADVSVIVTTLDSLDLLGTKSLLLELYDAFDRKTAILLNKVFPKSCTWGAEEKANLIAEMEGTFGRSVVGAIPCYCDVLKSDRSRILALEQPNHSFIKDLDETRSTLDKYIES